MKLIKKYHIDGDRTITYRLMNLSIVPFDPGYSRRSGGCFLALSGDAFSFLHKTNRDRLSLILSHSNFFLFPNQTLAIFKPHEIFKISSPLALKWRERRPKREKLRGMPRTSRQNKKITPHRTIGKRRRRTKLENNRRTF